MYSFFQIHTLFSQTFCISFSQKWPEGVFDGSEKPKKKKEKKPFLSEKQVREKRSVRDFFASLVRGNINASRKKRKELYIDMQESHKSDEKPRKKSKERKGNISDKAEKKNEKKIPKKLVSWLQKKKFPLYEKTANNCGKNVWEALNHFWIKWLPKTGRDGANWKNICLSSGKFQEISVTVGDAPPGSLISYDAVPGRGTKMRQKHGHVEIALGWGKYYFWKVSDTPGWSDRNPPLGTYRVFVPISL